MLSIRRMTGKPRNERRGRNSTGDRRHIRDMDLNKKMTTPDAAAPMGRWRVLAARFPGTIGGVIPSSTLRHGLFALFIGGVLAYGTAFAWYMLARFDLVNLIQEVIERRRLLLLPANPRPEYAPRNAPLRPNDL